MKVLITDTGTFNLFEYKGERIPAIFDLTELQLSIMANQGINFKILENQNIPRLVKPKLIDRDQELKERKEARIAQEQATSDFTNQLSSNKKKNKNSETEENSENTSE